MPSPVRTAPPSAQERERIVALLRAHAPEIRRRGVTRLALFGSTARGDAGPDSDVDLLVETDPASRFGLFALIDLKDDLGGLPSAARSASPSQTRCARGCAMRSCARRSRCSDGGAARPPARARTTAPHRRRTQIVASITIRNLDDALKARPRARAAQHGHSVEEEIQDILRTALADQGAAPGNLAEAIRRRFAAVGGADDLPAAALREPMRKPPGFDC